MCYKPIDYVSRDMVSDLNATYYKIKQKIQSTIDDNISLSPDNQITMIFEGNNSSEVTGRAKGIDS